MAGDGHLWPVHLLTVTTRLARFADVTEVVGLFFEERDRLIRQLHATGYSLRYLADVTGLSHQRILQITRKATHTIS